MNLSSIHDIDSFVLGEPCEPLGLTTSEENRLVSVVMVRQARRDLIILSRALDVSVYDDAEFADAVKELVLSSRQSRVRILVRDIAKIVSRGHRLLDLCRRLPSYIQIRVPAKEHQSYNSAFLISDHVGTVFRVYADRYDGSANFNDPGTAEDLVKLFEDMWEPAEVPSDLRQLSL